ncbi:MAG TPA: hypothetical protein VFI27_16990 [candidate division Zixibacteria bacterium]|nr:hypothetical protein [candidate division Zixibacteria bacterium]
MRLRTLPNLFFLSLLLVLSMFTADGNNAAANNESKPAELQDSESVVVIERGMDGTHGGYLNYGVYWHREEARVGNSGVTFGSFLGDHKIDDYYLILNLDTSAGQASGEFWATAPLDPDHPGESGTASISGVMTDGWVRYNAEIDAWEFGGSFDTRVTTSVLAWQGSIGDQDFWEDIALDVNVLAELRGGEFNSPNSGIYIGYEVEELPAGSHVTKWFNFYVSPAGLVNDFEPLRQAMAGSEATGEAPTAGEMDSDTANEPSPAVEADEPESEVAISDELLMDLIIAFTDPEYIGHIEGWDQLTETQQEGILTLYGIVVEVQETTNQAIANQPTEDDSDELTPYQQALYNQHRLEQLLDQKNKEELANLLEDKATSWQRIEQVVNEERIRVWGGNQGDWLKDVYQFVRGASLIKGATDKAGEWLGWVTNTQQAAEKAADRILLEPFSSGMTMEQVADQGLKLMSQMANVPTVIHFGYYQQQYQKYSEEFPAETAHHKALVDLRNMMLDPTEEFMIADGSRVVRGVWDNRYLPSAEIGGLYDKAFFDLRNSESPGVSK